MPHPPPNFNPRPIPRPNRPQITQIGADSGPLLFACSARQTDYSPPVLSPKDKTGAWLSLVERLVRDQEVAGSNPVAPTILMVNKTPIFTGVFVCSRHERHFYFPLHSTSIRQLPSGAYFGGHNSGLYLQGNGRFRQTRAGGHAGDTPAMPVPSGSSSQYESSIPTCEDVPPFRSATLFFPRGIFPLTS